jgi:hypothetical protein
VCLIFDNYATPGLLAPRGRVVVRRGRQDDGACRPNERQSSQAGVDHPLEHGSKGVVLAEGQKLSPCWLVSFLRSCLLRSCSAWGGKQTDTFNG